MLKYFKMMIQYIIYVAEQRNLIFTDYLNDFHYLIVVRFAYVNRFPGTCCNPCFLNERNREPMLWAWNWGCSAVPYF